MNNFSITPIEDTLANQENLTGLITLLDNTLGNSLKRLADYEEVDFAKIPDSELCMIAYQLMHDRNSLITLLNFLRKTVQEDTDKLTKAVLNYYKASKN